MPKSKINNVINMDRSQELVLLRVSVHALRDEMCRNLDEMLARIDRLLPDEDQARYQREKHCDWRKKVKSW